jgi:hypothetical protein
MTSTPIAKMFREMVARGVDPDMIALAIETAESAVRPVDSPVDAAAEKRRAYDRERQRLKRQSTGFSTGCPVDADSALTILEDSSKKKEKKERAKPVRGERLPPDAKPSAEHYEAAAKEGFTPIWVDHRFQDMRIWADTNAHRAVARKSDWNLTFTGWMRRSIGDAKGTRNGNGNHNAPRRSASADFFAGIASVAADIAGHDQPPRDAAPEVPLGRFNIDG